jgi:hypothetical protein
MFMFASQPTEILAKTLAATCSALLQHGLFPDPEAAKSKYNQAAGAHFNVLYMSWHILMRQTIVN